MEKPNMDSRYGKLSPEDQRVFNRWLKANAIVGAIFAIGFLAMALAGMSSVGPRDVEITSSAKVSSVPVSERRSGSVTHPAPQVRQKPF